MISAYAILFGGTLLLGGRLADLLGRRRLFLAGLALFATSSLLCGLAWSLASRHFDVAGAASITAGLMLLVYAMTRAASDGWGSRMTVALLTGSAVLVLAFVAIELRSRSPLLPLRIFRLKTLTAANATMAIVGAVAFSEFFLLTLYLQDVLGYSAVQTGAAFVAFAGTVVLASNFAQGFVLGGAGMGFSFVPITIASLSGVERADAGVASGLVNTSRQIGGAIGIAATSAIAAASTSGYVHSHQGLSGTSAVALDHGFQTGLYVLTGLLGLGALTVATLVGRAPTARAEETRDDAVVLDEAA